MSRRIESNPIQSESESQVRDDPVKPQPQTWNRFLRLAEDEASLVLLRRQMAIMDAS